MTTPDEIAVIARRLSKAQKAMVLTDSSGFAFGHQGKWHGPSVTAKKLYAQGLILHDRSLCHPTPLGITVRAYLEKNQ